MIKLLERKMNEYWSVKEAEMYRFEVDRIEDRENASRVVVKCFNADEESQEMVWLIGINENNNSAAIVEDLIKEFYNKYINPRTKEIKSFSGFINRKLNKLDKLMAKGCIDEVNLLNVEMVEQYKVMKKNKSECNYYKMFITLLYSVKGD